MEPFAAKSILTSLVTDYTLDIATFTTDRSSSMRTLMREPGLCHIGHQFDPWHWISTILFCIANINELVDICYAKIKSKLSSATLSLSFDLSRSGWRNPACPTGLVIK